MRISNGPNLGRVPALFGIPWGTLTVVEVNKHKRAMHFAILGSTGGCPGESPWDPPGCHLGCPLGAPGSPRVSSRVSPRGVPRCVPHCVPPGAPWHQKAAPYTPARRISVVYRSAAPVEYCRPCPGQPGNDLDAQGDPRMHPGCPQDGPDCFRIAPGYALYCCRIARGCSGMDSG